MATYSAYTDQELAALLKGGDRQAFTAIYDRYWSVLYAHVYKMLRDQEEAKDILQEVFSNLWVKAADVNEKANVPGLLYTAARNRVFNRIAHNKVKSDYLNSIADFMMTVNPNTVDQVDEKMLRAVIDEEIQKLPAKMREIFELSRMDNLSHKEIAARLNISDQTVKKQVQNALKQIKPRITELGSSLAVLILLR